MSEPSPENLREFILQARNLCSHLPQVLFICDALEHRLDSEKAERRWRKIYQAEWRKRARTRAR